MEMSSVAAPDIAHGSAHHGSVNNSGQVSGFIDRVFVLVEQADYRLATTPADREAIFRLRYDAYLREKAIAPTLSRRFTDVMDETDNSWIFGVYLEDKLASSIRLHVASNQHGPLPAIDVFGDVLQPEIAAGKTIIDPTRFVADPAMTRRFPHLPYLTVRLAWAACEWFNADYLLATVRAEHMAFYKRTFGHRLVGECRPYPQLAKPIGLMTLNYREERDRVRRKYPFFRSTQFERRMLFERPASEGAALQAA